ncbi:MAG: hypothetical protein ACLFVI_03910 [Archaeoglobaceae archaeon]
MNESKDRRGAKRRIIYFDSEGVVRSKRLRVSNDDPDENYK